MYNLMVSPALLLFGVSFYISACAHTSTMFVQQKSNKICLVFPQYLILLPPSLHYQFGSICDILIFVRVFLLIFIQSYLYLFSQIYRNTILLNFIIRFDIWHIIYKYYYITDFLHFHISTIYPCCWIKVLMNVDTKTLFVLLSLLCDLTNRTKLKIFARFHLWYNNTHNLNGKRESYKIYWHSGNTFALLVVEHQGMKKYLSFKLIMFGPCLFQYL